MVSRKQQSLPLGNLNHLIPLPVPDTFDMEYVPPVIENIEDKGDESIEDSDNEQQIIKENCGSDPTIVIRKVNPIEPQK